MHSDICKVLLTSFFKFLCLILLKKILLKSQPTGKAKYNSNECIKER